MDTPRTMRPIDHRELATSWPIGPQTVGSDEIVKAGLHLLLELDVFLAVGANRLDEATEAECNDLHAAILATSSALAVMHPRRKNGDAK